MRWLRLRGHLGLLSLLVISTPFPLSAQNQDSEATLSLDSLLNIPVSTASRYEQTSRQAPASVTVVTADEIRRFGFETLGDVLAHARGFYANDDRLVEQVGVRGISGSSQPNASILVLLNGQRRNDAYFDYAQIGTTFGVDLAIVERIEIVRGPGSASYGNNAVLAVVNVITKTAADMQDAFVSGRVGSFGRKDLTAGFTGRLGDESEIVANVFWSDVDGQDLYFPEFDVPQLNNGIAEQRDGEQAVGAFVELRVGKFTLSGGGQDRDKGVATGAFGSMFNEGTNTVSDTWVRSGLRYDSDLSPEVALSAGLSYDHSTITSELVMAQSGSMVDFESSAGRLTADAHIRFDPIPSNRVTAGIEFQDRANVQYEILAEGLPLALVESPFNTLGIWAQDEWSVASDLSLLVGARFDHHSTVGSALTPRAALVYDLDSNTSFKVLYGEAFRAPTPLELFVGQPGVLLGNPDLEPERVRTFEVVYERRLAESVLAVVSAYDIRARNLIDRIPDPISGIGAFQNQSSARATGVEGEVTFQPTARFGGSVGGTYLFTNEVEDRELPNSPQFLLRARVWAVGPAGVTLGAALRHDASRLTLQGSQTDGFSVVDVTLTSPEFSGLGAVLSLKNILDERYATPVGLELPQESIVQDGRSVTLSVRAWL